MEKVEDNLHILLDSFFYQVTAYDTNSMGLARSSLIKVHNLLHSYKSEYRIKNLLWRYLWTVTLPLTEKMEVKLTYAEGNLRSF